jgi:uncharacterized protein (DUF1501 family)
MSLSRRDFLKTASVGLGAMIVPGTLLRARPARAAGTDPVLVTVFLRGAADALNLLVPHQDATYYSLRPNIRVAPGAELDLDGFFGFHPTLAPLLPLFQSGNLAAIHCCGSPHDTRSHFDGQDFMEYAVPGDRTVQVGWLNRFLTAAGLSAPINAITIGNRAVKALAGPASTLAMPSITDLNFAGPTVFRRPAIETMYAASGNPLLVSLPSTTFSTADIVQSVSKVTSVVYPNTGLGAGLKDLAALIKGDVGVRLGAVDLGGWDHHANENVDLPIAADDLARSLAAFAEDLGSDLNRTLVLVMSEFGRRVRENGAQGSDHGHGGMMLALGGGIAGGRVILADDTWPGLAPAALFQGIDLPVTTDFRDVFAEALTSHMGLANASPVFPGYALDPGRYPGLFL